MVSPKGAALQVAAQVHNAHTLGDAGNFFGVPGGKKKEQEYYARSACPARFNL